MAGGRGHDPADGARRSRRGYYYQDLVALGRYLDVHDGLLDDVSVESDEDLVCRRSNPTDGVRFEQVKTVEAPTQLWSLADLCKAPKRGAADKSILGKLFLAKSLPSHAELRLVLNERVKPELQLLCQPVRSRDPAAESALAAKVAAKLKPVKPADGRTIEWCVERLDVIVEERTSDALEDRLLGRLERLIRPTLQLLAEEVETGFRSLMDQLQREARAPARTTVDRAEIGRRIADVIDAARRALQLPAPGSASTLREKLKAAGLNEGEIDGCVAMHLAHRHNLRSADPDHRRVLIDLADELFHVCTQVSMDRREGKLADGHDTFRATFARVEQHFNASAYPTNGVTLADCQRAVHDIASRCRHRYAP